MQNLARCLLVVKDPTYNHKQQLCIAWLYWTNLLHKMLHVTQYANVDGGGGPTFFEEETTYWKPASDARNLYKQLSSKKYRELPRRQIR